MIILSLGLGLASGFRFRMRFWLRFGFSLGLGLGLGLGFGFGFYCKVSCKYLYNSTVNYWNVPLCVVEQWFKQIVKFPSWNVNRQFRTLYLLNA